MGDANESAAEIEFWDKGLSVHEAMVTADANSRYFAKIARWSTAFDCAAKVISIGASSAAAGAFFASMKVPGVAAFLAALSAVLSATNMIIGFGDRARIARELAAAYHQHMYDYEALSRQRGTIAFDKARERFAAIMEAESKHAPDEMKLPRNGDLYDKLLGEVLKQRGLSTPTRAGATTRPGPRPRALSGA